MSGALWICEACGNHYGGSEGSVCSCGDAALNPDEGVRCQAWVHAENQIAMALSGDPHQAAAFLDQALTAVSTERLNGHSPSGGRCEDDELDYSGVDPLIRPFVRTLRYHGVNTYMSCQGGTWHPDRLPWIAFGGAYRSAGLVAMLVDHYSWPAIYLDRRFFLQGGNMGHKAWVLIFSGIDERDAADAEARLNHTIGAATDTIRRDCCPSGSLASRVPSRR